MFVEAHKRYATADREIDYVTSILLSGAVIGVIGPLLKEQGGRTTHELLAKIGNIISESGEDPSHEGMFRAVYNSLKHAGNKTQNIRPSDDLEIRTDLRLEAAHMLDAAKDDFLKIEMSSMVKSSLSVECIELLQSEGSYT